MSRLTSERFTENHVERLNTADLQFTLKLLLGECEALLESRGISTRPASPATLEKFLHLSTQRQALILDELQCAFTILNEMVGDQNPEKMTRDREIKILSRYLSRVGLKVAKSEVMNLIDEEDVVEIYTTTGIQIFRSWSCFRVCSYSLADLLIYDWATLYDRPSAAVTHVQNSIVQAISSETPLVKYQIPEYIMTERFDGHNNAFYFNMKYLVAVLDEKTNEVRGIMSTGAARLASAPKFNLNVSFI